MKKIVIRDEEVEVETIYFDFKEDFPKLACQWISSEEGMTDTRGYIWYFMQRLINKLPHEDCTEYDYARVKDLVESWDLLRRHGTMIDKVKLEKMNEFFNKRIASIDDFLSLADKMYQLVGEEYDEYI